MSTEVEEIIKEIAIRHGIAVGRDDPIMVLRTINEILLKDSMTAQAEILSVFKSELEEAANRWDLAANEKAEKMLNISLNASKKAMSSMLDAGVKSAIEEIHSSLKADKNSALDLIHQSMKENRNVSMLNLVASALTITAALIAVFAITT